MVKKISAILLALVLCLSVVLPVAAAGFADDYTLPADAKVAYLIETDKANYSAGETVLVKVYIKADDTTEFAGGTIALACNSAVFDATDTANSKTAIPAGYEHNAAWESYYKSGASCTTAWLAAAMVTKVVAANTAEENALYDQYLKITLAKNSAGTHEYAASARNGISGAELNDDTDPFIVIPLKLRDDLADGTEINLGFTSGSASTAAASQISFKYYNNPGVATTTASVAQTEFDFTNAVATATIGAATTTPVEFQKAQIRFKGITATSGAATYQNSFDVRTVAQITEANFATFFTDEATAKEKISKFGFVYAAKSNVADFDVATAKAVAEGGSATNYVDVPVTYMQHTGGNYIFTCLISNIADADKTDGVNCLGYVCFDGTYYYFDAAASVDFNTLYTTNMPA